MRSPSKQLREEQSDNLCAGAFLEQAEHMFCGGAPRSESIIVQSHQVNVVTCFLAAIRAEPRFCGENFGSMG